MTTNLKTQVPEIKSPPRIRKLSSLYDINTPAVVIKKEEPRGTALRLVNRGFIFVTILLFSALGLSLFTINRLDRTNKEYNSVIDRIYPVVLSQKKELVKNKQQIDELQKINGRISYSRMQLLKGYKTMAARNNDSEHKYLEIQGKQKAYRKVLKSKLKMTGILKAEIALANTKIDSLQIQKDMLATQSEKNSELIQTLTAKLRDSVKQQQLLIQKNIAYLKTMGQEGSRQ